MLTSNVTWRKSTNLRQQNVYIFQKKCFKSRLLLYIKTIRKPQESISESKSKQKDGTSGRSADSL